MGESQYSVVPPPDQQQDATPLPQPSSKYSVVPPPVQAAQPSSESRYSVIPPPTHVGAPAPKYSVVPPSQQSTWDEIKQFANKPLTDWLPGSDINPQLMIEKAGVQSLKESGHPYLAAGAGALTGIHEASTELQKGLETPLNIGLGALTGGTGAVGRVVGRLAAGLFSYQQIKDAYRSIPAVKDAILNQDYETASKLIAQAAESSLLAGVGAAHALGAGEEAPIATVPRETPAEEPATVSTKQEAGLPAGMIDELTKPINVDHQIMSIHADTQDLEAKLRAGAGSPEERQAAQDRINQNNEIVADLTYGQSLGKQHLEATNAALTSGRLSEPTSNDIRQSISLSGPSGGAEQAETDIPSEQGNGFWGVEADTQGEQHPQPFGAPGLGEENLRSDSGITGREGAAATGTQLDPDSEAGGGVGTGLSDNVVRVYDGPDQTSEFNHMDISGWQFTGERENLNVEGYAPDYLSQIKGPNGSTTWVKENDLDFSQLEHLSSSPTTLPAQALGAASQLSEAATGQPLDAASILGPPPNAPPTAPAAQQLANGGITLVRPGQDIGLISRYLGSLSEIARRTGNTTLSNLAQKISWASIDLARNQRDVIKDFRSSTRTLVTRGEFSDQLVPLLDDAKVNLGNIDQQPVADNIKQAYKNERARLSQLRLDLISAKRAALIASGVSPKQAVVQVPDTWGIEEGYFHHAFPGNWIITKLNPSTGNYYPIDTGWRAVTFDEAHAKAKEFLAANPASQLNVKLDQATMPGTAYTDKNRLANLHDEIKAASQLIYNGANPDGVLRDLKNESAAALYGPRRPAQRSTPSILERETNLPGYMKDIDTYESTLLGMERYKVLAPVRQEVMLLRNQLANISGMPGVQRIAELPNRPSGQYANMIGKVDASIEALEGYPTGLNAAIRNSLQNHGHDPNMVDRAFSYMNQAEAVLKLGYNPASAGLHLAQTAAATYPVLGEKYTTLGIVKSYSPAYDALVHKLGIEASSNLLDIDSFQSYKGGYLQDVMDPALPTSQRLATAGAAGYQFMSKVGLYAFSKGIETARRVAAIGAYQKGIDEGMTVERATQYAKDVMVRTQFDYSAPDAASALHGLPGPVRQFKTFTLKMAEFMTGLQGAEIPRFLVGMGLLGYAGLPALQQLGSLWSKMPGTNNYDPYEDIKKQFPRASRGVLGFLGIDYTRNIGFSDWLGPHSLDPDKAVGPVLSDLYNLAKAGLGKIGPPSRQGSQDATTAVRNLATEPRRIYDEVQRMASGQNNLVDPRSGATIIKNLTPSERVEMLAGFTPMRVAIERDTHERVMKEIASSKDQRGYFVDRMADLYLQMGQTNDEHQRSDLMQQMTNLSNMAQEYGQSRQLSQAVRQRAKEMSVEREGRDTKHAPKQLRGTIQQEQQQNAP